MKAIHGYQRQTKRKRT